MVEREKIKLILGRIPVILCYDGSFCQQHSEGNFRHQNRKMFQKETFVKKENASLFPSFSGESAVSFFCNQIEWFNLKRLPSS